MNPRLVIWGAIVFSTVLYFAIAVFLTADGSDGDFEQRARNSYVPVLYVLALLSFVVAWLVVPRVVRSGEQARMICALAMFEACAVFGLIAAFLTQDWRFYLGPWALAIFGFIRELPRETSRTSP